MKSLAMIRTAVALTLVALAAVPALAKDDGLSLVPANAVTVGMVKIAELRSSPLSSIVFEHTDQMSTNGEAEKFLTDAGLSLTKDIDVLVVATSPRTNLGSEADVLVVAEGRFDAERLTKALLARGAVQKNGYLMPPAEDDSPNDGAIAFPTSSLAIAGTERAVVAALAARKQGGTGFVTRGGLAMDLVRIDPSASAWALVDVARAARLAKVGDVNTGSGHPGDALKAALKSVSTMAIWASDKGDSLELGAFGVSADAETLALIEDTVRGALSALRLAVKDQAPEMVPVLRRFDVSRANNAVVVAGSIPADTLRDVIAKKRASIK